MGEIYLFVRIFVKISQEGFNSKYFSSIIKDGHFSTVIIEIWLTDLQILSEQVVMDFENNNKRTTSGRRGRNYCAVP